ncbi:MAG: DUF445 family protein [Drouetiella hepatica Uher 2000/2452]|uniref:DUF445 family protein n=1 Tax=Drouetiella hepatica Uher 2000/2452 TaxID=904376 RepID=A0A951QCP2_9CYAN|nr:DUF445 family protein [Drouetiella hepatica Uher 2000/2452]
MDLATLWTLAAPPIVGGIIGYFTNDIAIKMLFRPYRALYVGGRRLPFTPGLIPSNQERLAKRIADTIMGSLLTPDELKNLARKLLQTERIQAAIYWLLGLALEQAQGANEEKAIKIVANILRDLLGQSLPRLIKVMARREDFLETQLNQIFDQVLLELRLTEAQAVQLSSWLLETVLPPDAIRQVLVDFLTDRNIRVIDEGLREKTSGTYWVVANLFGVRNTLTRLRTYCLDDREQSNARIAELVTSLGIQARLKELLQNLSLQNLPVSTVRQLRKTMRDSVRGYVQLKGSDVLQGLSDSIDWNNVAALLLNRLRTSDAVTSALQPVSQELTLVLERYLERDLEMIVAQAIPILNIDQVIIDRVRATSPKDLELAIQGIVKSELQAIVNLGGVLGLVIGLLQTVSLLLQ